jgi:hypothetical protein
VSNRPSFAGGIYSAGIYSELPANSRILIKSPRFPRAGTTSKFPLFIYPYSGSKASTESTNVYFIWNSQKLSVTPGGYVFSLQTACFNLVSSATYSTRANFHYLVKEQPKSVHALWSTVGSRGNTQPQQSTNILLLRRRFSRLLSLCSCLPTTTTKLSSSITQQKQRKRHRPGRVSTTNPL